MRRRLIAALITALMLSLAVSAWAVGGYILTEAGAGDCINAENNDRLITEDVSAGVGPCAAGPLPPLLERRPPVDKLIPIRWGR